MSKTSVNARRTTPLSFNVFFLENPSEYPHKPYEGRSVSNEKSSEWIFISRNHVAIRNLTSYEACLEKYIARQ